MPSDPGNLPEQEHSIKAREHELYAKPVQSRHTKKAKPFPVYLREIPAEPLAGTTKVMLWMVGAIVALLFLAAVWRVTQRQRPRSARLHRERRKDSQSANASAALHFPVNDRRLRTWACHVWVAPDPFRSGLAVLGAFEYRIVWTEGQND